MMNRRALLKAAGAAAIAGGGACGFALTQAGRAPHAVLFDSRYSESAAFASQFQDGDILRIDTAREDIGLAWRRRISRLAAKPGAQIVGFSLHTDLFISQIMAREFGLKVLDARRFSPTLIHHPELYLWTLA